MKGWRYEGYRHSLAARGIKTNFAVIGFTPERRQQILTYLAQNPRLKEKLMRSTNDIVAFDMNRAVRTGELNGKPVNYVSAVVGAGYMVPLSDAKYADYLSRVDLAEDAMAASAADMQKWMNSEDYESYKRLPGASLAEKREWLSLYAPKTVYVGSEDPTVFEEGSPNFRKVRALDPVATRKLGVAIGLEPGSKEWNEAISERLNEAIGHEIEHGVDYRKLSIPTVNSFEKQAQIMAEEEHANPYYWAPHELKAYLQTGSGGAVQREEIGNAMAQEDVRKLLAAYYGRLQRSPKLKTKRVIWNIGPGEEEIFMPNLSPEEAASNLAYFE